MKTLNKTLALTVLAVTLLSTSAFAQLSASADILITLVKGLSIENIGESNIAFGEVIVTSSEQKPEVKPEYGAHFVVSGHPGKKVTISFEKEIKLDNSEWAKTYDAGSTSSIVFEPFMEQTGKEKVYASGSPEKVLTGNSVALENHRGTGYLNLWVGGSILVKEDQPQGDYRGKFTVTVAY